MGEFQCSNCQFETSDASLPECPYCGGYLKEKEEVGVAVDDMRTSEELYY